jgi:hypothetical protein
VDVLCIYIYIYIYIHTAHINRCSWVWNTNTKMCVFRHIHTHTYTPTPTPIHTYTQTQKRRACMLHFQCSAKIFWFIVDNSNQNPRPPRSGVHVLGIQCFPVYVYRGQERVFRLCVFGYCLHYSVNFFLLKAGEFWQEGQWRGSS